MKNYKKINDHYNNLIQKHGFNQHGMGCRKGFLNKRYSIFLKHLKFNDKRSWTMAPVLGVSILF